MQLIDVHSNLFFFVINPFEPPQKCKSRKKVTQRRGCQECTEANLIESMSRSPEIEQALKKEAIVLLRAKNFP